MEKIMALEPDYFAGFQCDGRRCGACCCRRRWGILVDEGTYQKYLALQDEDREWVLKNIVQEPPGNSSKGVQGQGMTQRHNLNLTEGCPFLRDDRLCALQRKFGEDYICDTCALYPRKIMQIGSRFERSLSLSCPLVAELALLRQEPVRFVTNALPTGRESGWQQTATGEGEEGMAEAFWLLQQTGIAILQNQGKTVQERLRTLLAFLRESDEAVEKGEMGELMALAARYQEDRGEMVSLPADRSIWLQELKRVLVKVETANEHKQAVEPMATERELPPWPLFWENFLVSEYFFGIYPCRLGGSLQHNGEVFLALSDLLEEAVREPYQAGDAAGVLAACVRLATLADHDKDWLAALSLFVDKVDK